jgi:hypothetical protein
MTTSNRGENDPSNMRAFPGFWLLIPVLFFAFSGCESTGSSVGSGTDSAQSLAGPGTGAARSPLSPGSDSTPASQEIPQSGANAPAMTTESAALQATAIPDGIARVHGKYYVLRSGNATLLDQKERFSQGLEFDRNGRIILKDGNIVRLREHEMVTFSGERRDVPWNIRLPKPLPPGPAAQTSPL